MRRPYTTYSETIAQRILDELDRGRPLKRICRDDGMPTEATVQRWIRHDLNGFAARYRVRARPSGGQLRYTREIADRVCDELRKGRTLFDICEDDGMPSDSGVLHWAKIDRDGFRARFREAREIGYLAIADEILEIADDGRNDWMLRRAADGSEKQVLNGENVRRSKLRVTARCWLLSRMLPRVFGNRLGVHAVHEADDSIAKLMKHIDGLTRGLPASVVASATVPAAEGAGQAGPSRPCCASCGRPLP